MASNVAHVLGRRTGSHFAGTCAAGSLTWFANHELRLAWRDWLSMMTAGRRGRERIVAVALTIFIVFAHLLAWYFVARYVNVGTGPDKPALVVITGTVLLSWSLLMSQAMESVTRAFYARSDLDLILSSPTAARKIFAVRIGAMALSVILMAALLGAPIINVGDRARRRALARRLRRGDRDGRNGGGLRGCAHGRAVPHIGPKRTRLAAQIVAAVIAAVFIIGLQVAAILSTDRSRAWCFSNPTRWSRWCRRPTACCGSGARRARRSHCACRRARRQPRAARRRDPGFFGALRRSRHRGIEREGDRRAAGLASAFRRRSPARALRQKEWTLLLRDPWLVSQTLMQLLYLLPPALLLWRSYGEGTGALVVLVPVLVMAAGQLAGGLAWLAISGEDAPDLVATAPVLARNIMRAKVEAVLGGIAIAFAPFIAALAFYRSSRAPCVARHPRGGGRRDRHPVLVPQTGDAALFPSPPDRVALCDLRGSVLVDLMGGDRGACGRGQLGGVVSCRDRRRDTARGALDEPA